MKKEQKANILKVLQNWSKITKDFIEMIESNLQAPALKNNANILEERQKNESSQLTLVEKIEAYKTNKENYLTKLKEKEQERARIVKNEKINDVIITYARNLKETKANILLVNIYFLMLREIKTQRDKSDFLNLMKYDNAKNNGLGFYASIYDDDFNIYIFNDKEWGTKAKASFYLGSDVREALAREEINNESEAIKKDIVLRQKWQQQYNEILAKASYNYNELKRNVEDLQTMREQQAREIERLQKEHKTQKEALNDYGVLTFINDIFK